jgi:hypothetical protein
MNLQRRLELMSLNPNYLYGSAFVGGRRCPKGYRKACKKIRGGTLVGGCEGMYGDALVGGSEANYNNTWQQYLVDFRNSCGASIAGKPAYIVAQMAAPGYPAWLQQLGLTDALRRYQERQVKGRAHCATARGLMYAPGGRITAQQAYKYPKLVPHPYVCPLPGKVVPTPAQVNQAVKLIDKVATNLATAQAPMPLTQAQQNLLEQELSMPSGEGYYGGRRRRMVRRRR